MSTLSFDSSGGNGGSALNQSSEGRGSFGWRKISGHGVDPRSAQSIIAPSADEESNEYGIEQSAEHGWFHLRASKEVPVTETVLLVVPYCMRSVTLLPKSFEVHVMSYQ